VTPFTWDAKACPCGDYQKTECLHYGCEWERDPSKVPEALRRNACLPEPSDEELIRFAVEEQFLLFCDEDSFIQIARAVLQKYGK
jgi:hypothetical protein